MEPAKRGGGGVFTTNRCAFGNPLLRRRDGIKTTRLSLHQASVDSSSPSWILLLPSVVSVPARVCGPFKRLYLHFSLNFFFVKRFGSSVGCRCRGDALLQGTHLLGITSNIWLYYIYKFSVCVIYYRRNARMLLRPSRTRWASPATRLPFVKTLVRWMKGLQSLE